MSGKVCITQPKHVFKTCKIIRLRTQNVDLNFCFGLNKFEGCRVTMNCLLIQTAQFTCFK